MSYKTGAEYIHLYAPSYYGYQENDKIVVAAEESCSEIVTYNVIKNGEVVYSISEDGWNEDERTSIIDALYALKHGTQKNSKLKKNDDMTREEVDEMFHDFKVPDKLKEITNKATDNWWDK